MAIQSTDTHGPFLDTGVNTLPTVRANTEVEIHTSIEIDSGSKLLPATTLVPSHNPHREKNNPR